MSFALSLTALRCLLWDAEYALSKGLKVMYCIGESLDERNANKTIEVLKSQVRTIPPSQKA